MKAPNMIHSPTAKSMTCITPYTREKATAMMM